MGTSVIVNISDKHIFEAVKFIARQMMLCLLIVTFLILPVASAQTPGKSSSEQSKTSSIPAFTELLKRPVNFRPELKGVHPRLFFSKEVLNVHRIKAKNSDRELWQAVLKDIQTLKRDAPDPKDEDLYKSGLDKRKEGSISQYEFAFQIAQTSYAYAIEDNEKYLAAARKWTLAACEMPIWGYTYNKPNVDLPPAHLLYAVSFAYDILFDKLTNEEKETIKNKLVKQSRLMYDYFKYKPNKKYTYTQNHTWIPMAGLAIAAYVLMDEVNEAKDWALLSRAVFDRTMLAFATDGYFYESFHYFGFAFRWMIRYFDAHLQATGENLYEPMRGKFVKMKYFVTHSILPDRENVFDFADVGDGSLNRNGTSKREKLYGEYDILYRFASVYRDSQAQTIADFIRTETNFDTREPMWAFINHDSNLKPAPLSDIPTSVYFEDNDTVFWRSDWTKNATAFTFRCAPPEGHHAARLARKISDWRENTGHAHPDANSFIIFANGRYLTGDTGYLGIKQTDDHNTILVNNRGQEKDGVYEMFKEVSNERLDKIQIAEVWATRDYFYVRGEAASGYYTDLGLKKFDRHFLYVAPDYFIVWDELETEKPSEFSFLINTDREIKLNGGSADLINQDAGLRVVRIAPNDAVSKVVPQMIQARGLPGSVDKGIAEQRGLQLQITTATKQTKLDFLHFLQPFSVSQKSDTPKVSRVDNNLIIVWTNGDEDFISLRPQARFVLRREKSGALKRLVVQNQKEIVRNNETIATFSKSLSAAFNFSNANEINILASAAENAEARIKIQNCPASVQINGEKAKFDCNEATRILSFNIKANKNQAEK